MNCMPIKNLQMTFPILNGAQPSTWGKLHSLKGSESSNSPTWHFQAPSFLVEREWRPSYVAMECGRAHLTQTCVSALSFIRYSRPAVAHYVFLKPCVFSSNLLLNTYLYHCSSCYIFAAIKKRYTPVTLHLYGSPALKRMSLVRAPTVVRLMRSRANQIAREAGLHSRTVTCCLP